MHRVKHIFRIFFLSNLSAGLPSAEVALIESFANENMATCTSVDVAGSNVQSFFDSQRYHESPTITYSPIASTEKSSCKVLLLASEDKLNVALASQVLRRTYKTMIIVSGRSHSEIDVTGSLYSILYVEQSDSPDRQSIFVLCPTLNTAGKWTHLGTFNTKTGRFFSKYGMRGALKICPHPLNDASVNVAWVYRLPTARPSKEGMVGYDVDLLKLVGEKFKFKPNYVLGEYSNIHFLSHDELVSNGTAEFGIGTMVYFGHKAPFLDYTFPIYHTWDILGSRIPIRLPPYENLILPFPRSVWITSFSLFCAMSFIFMCFQETYAKIDAFPELQGEADFTVQVYSKFDFVIKTFSTLTEPIEIKWFPRWSAGKFLVFIWSIFCLFIGLFYTSNLRAFLISPAFEDLIEYPRQIHARGQRMYIPNVYRITRTETPEFRQLTKDVQEMVHYSVATGGVYRPDLSVKPLPNPGALSPTQFQDVLQNGAVFVSSALVTSHFVGVYRHEKIYYGTKPYASYVAGFKMPKARPWLRDVDRCIANLVAQGMDIRINERYSFPQKAGEDDGLDKIGVTNLSTAFFFYLVGMAVASVVFAIEFRKGTIVRRI